jgi:Na+/H+ antiporter NhaD/arsenite permease-like protein
MSMEAWFTVAVVLVCLGLLASNRVAPDLVMTAGLTLLLVAGVLSPPQALAGLANEGLVTVAVLYIVVTGLTETGAVGWLVQSVLGRPRSLRQAQIRMMLPVAGLSGFLNNTPVVAVFIPVLQDWANAIDWVCPDS